MKKRTFVTFLLLFAFVFSMGHEYFYASYDSEHCSAQEYVAELTTPPQDASHSDICDIHFEYHQSFLLLVNPHISSPRYIQEDVAFDEVLYSFKSYLDFFKPPILPLYSA